MAEVAWHDLGPADGFEEGKLHGRLIDGVRLCYGLAGGSFFAMDDTCPHAGGSLTDGMLDGDLAICPIHAWAFETRTGRCVEDARCSVATYPIRVEDGIVRVQLPPPAPY